MLIVILFCLRLALRGNYCFPNPVILDHSYKADARMMQPMYSRSMIDQNKLQQQQLQQHQQQQLTTTKKFQELLKHISNSAFLLADNTTRKLL